MTEFTPIASAAGGALIGIAAALLLLGLGRMAGISDIVGQALARDPGPGGWRVAFLLGLPAGAFLASHTRPAWTLQSPVGPVLLVVAGLLVGFGTRLGSGCTSGHGVCGLARGSRRSFVATATFMGAGFVTVTLLRHVFGGSF